MAIAVVQAVGNAGAHNGTTYDVTISPTAGSSLIVGVCKYNGTTEPSSIVDSLGNAFTKDSGVTVVAASTNIRMCFYHLSNIAGGITKITVTYAANYSDSMAVCLEATGLDNTTPKDVADSAGVGGTGTTWTTAAMTPTAGINALVIGFAYDFTTNHSMGAGTGYTAIGLKQDANSGQACVMGYQLVASTTGSYTPNGTTSGTANEVALGIILKAAAAASGVVSRNLMLTQQAIQRASSY